MTRILLEKSHKNFFEAWDTFRALLTLSGSKFSRNLPAISRKEDIDCAIASAVGKTGGNYLSAPCWRKGDVLTGNIGDGLGIRLLGNTVHVIVSFGWISDGPEGLAAAAAKALAVRSILEEIDLED